MSAWRTGLCVPRLGFLSPSEMSQSQGLWDSKISHAAVPAKLTRGLYAPLFGGRRTTRDVPAAPPGFPNPFQTLLHSASFINWIIWFLRLLLSESN